MTGLRHIGRATPCLLAMLVLLGAAGCGDEPTSVPPPTESCVVEGVLSHAVPKLFDNQVQFTRAAGPDYYVTATVDNAGHYRMELPSGDYIVAALSDYRTYYLAPGGVLTQSWSEADTLRLLQQYSVDFIYYGNLEKFHYPAGEAKFAALANQGALTPVYNQQGTLIYKVNAPAGGQ